MPITRTRTFAKFTRRLCLLGLLGILLGGCAGRGNVEVLEAQLRNQESLLSKYEKQLQRMESNLSVAQRESDLLRSQLAETQGKRLFQETTQALAEVEGLKFHGMLTAGRSNDDQPGDERLHAVLYPHDRYGELVKLSGTLELEAIDLSLPPDQRTVGLWQFSPEETRELWHSGFLTNGYQLDLPWMKTPQGDQILLHAKLSTPDGRSFDATHTVRIEEPTLSKLDQPASDLLAPPFQQASGFQQIQAEAIVREVAKEQKFEPRGEQPDDGINWQDRKVPRPAPLEPVTIPVPSNEPARISLPDNASPLEAADANKARPFPSGMRTSVNWTDATIPVLR